jgi:hypothetical protein
MPPRKFVLPRNNDGEGLLPVTKKPWAGKQRPEGMSNTEWAADFAQRAVVNQDRRKREATAKMFEKQEVKIGLLNTNVAAIKRKEDLRS